MGISLDKAEFLSLFLETFMYGVFFTLCLITVIILVRLRKVGTKTERSLLPVAIIMLFLATGHIIIDFIRALDAFLLQKSEDQSSVAKYYGNLADPLFVSKTVLYWLQTMLGDSIIIWRCYIVYGRQWGAIGFPLVLLTAAFVSGVVILRTLTHFIPGATIFETGNDWITVFFVLTMVINIYCTCFITWRIYSTGRLHPGFGNLMPVIVVLVESGAIYTSNIIAFLCAFLSHSNGQYAALDLITPVVGIVFCLIILQVKFHFGIRSAGSSTGSSVQQAPSRSGRFTGIHNGQATYPLAPLAIEITTHTEGPYAEDVDMEMGKKSQALSSNSM